MNPIKRMALVAGVLGALLAACQLIAGVEQEADTPRPEKAPPVPDAGPPDVDPCPHARPPGPPSGATENTKSTTHTFAVRNVVVGGLDDLPSTFDFDNLCSCQNRDMRDPNPPATSCVQAVPACTPSGNTDDDRGADLGGKGLVQRLKSTLETFTRAELHDKFESGQRGILIRVGDYNETLNDASVTVALVSSVGIFRRPDRTATRDAGACEQYATDAQAPSWADDAGDTWYRENKGVPVTTASGYVVDGKLVIDSAATSYKVPMFGQFLEESHPILVAELGKTADKAMTLRGNLVGITSASKVLRLFGTFQDPLSPGKDSGLCDNPTIVSVFTEGMCNSRDLLELGKDPTAPCDAFALALGMEAFEITEGPDSPDCPTLPTYACDASCPPIGAGGK